MTTTRLMREFQAHVNPTGAHNCEPLHAGTKSTLHMWQQLVEKLESMIPPEGEVALSKVDRICLDVARRYLSQAVLDLLSGR